MTKQILGQFFTNKNIFAHQAFMRWLEQIPVEKSLHVLEPFAGKNGLIHMLQSLKIELAFTSFDIQPQSPEVQYRDTIADFPGGYKLCITNPPFLAKNMATRKNLDIEIEPFNDLYQRCLDLCLKHCDYVAAIVPESFIVSEFFKSRLQTVISLTQKTLFSDTEHPVCLALFGPMNGSDFEIYCANQYIGYFKEIKNDIHGKLQVQELYPVKFHKPQGALGLICIDATSIEKQIRFCPGIEIEEKDVGYHSRLRTRIDITRPDGQPLSEQEVRDFIGLCNKTVHQYRKDSHDIFLTAFKGLRTDGVYRRRLDFNTARMLVAKSYEIFFKSTL